MDDDTALAEQAALLDHLLGELGCQQAGVMGWCLGGGSRCLLGASEHRLANVVAYHPTVPSKLRRITRTTRSPRPPGSPRR